MKGSGWRWNPEFTMLEAYQAYTDYLGIMDTTQGSIEQAVQGCDGRDEDEVGRATRLTGRTATGGA